MILTAEESGFATDVPLFTQGCILILLGLVPVILWFLDHRQQRADAAKAAADAQKHEEDETAKLVHIVEEVLAHDKEQQKQAFDAINDQRDDDRAAAAQRTSDSHDEGDKTPPSSQPSGK